MLSALNKVKFRIRALSLKTVDNGCTEAEAISAMDKVGELLEVYNLNMTEVELSAEPCVEVKFGLRRRTIPRWGYIFMTISKFTHTTCWANRPNIHFFGIETDVQMAIYLCEIVTAALAAETTRFRATPVYKSSLRRRFMTSSFTAGLIRRLADRLVINTPTGKGIVPHKMAYVHNQLRHQMPELQLRARRTRAIRINQDAYAAGQSAGDRVNLNRPISSNSNPIGLLT